MTNESLMLLVEDLFDFLNSVEAAIAQFKGQINKNFGPKGEKTWNPEKIKWEQAVGSNGPYQRYPAEGQKVEATEDYRNMVRDLKAHNGRLTRDGYFYWLFRDKATVGRKKRG